MRRTHRLLLSLSILAVAGLASLPAQEPLGADKYELIGQPEGTPLTGAELDRHTEELTSLMRCPVCQGLSIADSGTMIALAMKAEVREFLARGYTDDQILDYFELSYGEFIRLQPKPTGFNLFVWIAPLAAFLLGLAIVVYRLRSAGAASEPQEVPAKDAADGLASYRERVRKELAS
jgi:cytochrome c-type biogenesis protein CcmH